MRWQRPHHTPCGCPCGPCGQVMWWVAPLLASMDNRPWCRDANRGLHRDPVVVPVLPRTLPHNLVNVTCETPRRRTAPACSERGLGFKQVETLPLHGFVQTSTAVGGPHARACSGSPDRARCGKISPQQSQQRLEGRYMSHPWLEWCPGRPTSALVFCVMQARHICCPLSVRLGDAHFFRCLSVRLSLRPSSVERMMVCRAVRPRCTIAAAG